MYLTRIHKFFFLIWRGAFASAANKIVCVVVQYSHPWCIAGCQILNCHSLPMHMPVNLFSASTTSLWNMVMCYLQITSLHGSGSNFDQELWDQDHWSYFDCAMQFLTSPYWSNFWLLKMHKNLPNSDQDYRFVASMWTRPSVQEH